MTTTVQIDSITIVDQAYNKLHGNVDMNVEVKFTVNHNGFPVPITITCSDIHAMDEVPRQAFTELLSLTNELKAAAETAAQHYGLKS